MSNNKQSLTELEATGEIIQVVMSQAKDNLEMLDRQLSEMYKGQFIIEDKQMGAFDFALAQLSLESQAIDNLFPKDQAKRIHEYILQCIDSDDYGEYAKHEYNKYREAFAQDLERHGNGIDAITARLLHRLLKENIKNFADENRILSPLLVLSVTGVIVQLGGMWKHIKENYHLEKV